MRFNYTALLDAVRRRSHGRCELLHHEGCTDVATEMHHRRMRSAGGLDIVDNILHLCHTAHQRRIHAHPKWAYRHGLLLRRGGTDHPPPILGCDLDCTVDHYV